jgi:hypothetical protein
MFRREHVGRICRLSTEYFHQYAIALAIVQIVGQEHVKDFVWS